MTGVQTCALPISLGISLGSNILEKSNSAREIENLELQRAVHILEKNVDSMGKGDVGPHNLVLTTASSISEDLIDEEFADVVDHLDPPFCEGKQTRGRKKKEHNNSTVRRSVRIKKQKQKKK